MRIHVEIGDLGSGIQRSAYFLESHVNRDMNEVFIGGGECAGEIEERVDTEFWVQSTATCTGHGLRGPAILQTCGIGVMSYDNHEGGGDGGRHHEYGGEY